MHGGEVRGKDDDSVDVQFTLHHFSGEESEFIRPRPITTGQHGVGRSSRDSAYLLYHGDCLEAMRRLPDCSVDSIVCDPPYGLSFMGKTWDKSPPGLAFAKQALRVLKPGGHAIVFGGTRTVHRVTTSLEEAGFEVRDVISWCYWSGFPKGMDIAGQFDKQTVRDLQTGELVYGRDLKSVHAVIRFIAAGRDQVGYTNKMIDEHFGLNGMAGHWTTESQPRVPMWEQWGELKRILELGDEMDSEVWRLNGRKGEPGDAWKEREVVGEYASSAAVVGWRRAYDGEPAPPSREPEYAKDRWSHYHDGARARTEPLTENALNWRGWNTALKPAIEPAVLVRKPLRESSVAANVLEYGTAALNIDACRQSYHDNSWPGPKPNTRDGKLKANHSTGASGVGSGTGAEIYGYREGKPYLPDTGGWWPANLYYCSKPSKKEREAGLDDFEAQMRMPNLDPTKEWVGGHNAYLCGGAVARRNNHPTVKPISLMRWMCRLVTPPGGVVLDPFMGSGSTGCAAMLEGLNFIGCEMMPLPSTDHRFDAKTNIDAYGIAMARIKHWRNEAANEAWTAEFGTIGGFIQRMEAE